MEQEAPRPLLGARRVPGQEPLVIVALRRLANDAPAKFTERSEELAYLSNVLLAAATPDGRRLRPLEAVEHAMACVSLGLLLVSGPRTPSATRAARDLARYPCDGLFRLALSTVRSSNLATEGLVDAATLAKVRSLLKPQ